jgi:hypothetical protein
MEGFEDSFHNKPHQFGKRSYTNHECIRLNQSTRRRWICHGDSSSLDDACSRPRWVVNDLSSETSFSVPFDTPTSSGSGNGFENLISD